MSTDTKNLKMLTFRVPRNLINRLKRASAIQGVSQSSIVILYLDQGLSRWEREYSEQVKLREDIGFAGDEFDIQSDDSEKSLP
jgi:hypothetical protein